MATRQFTVEERSFLVTTYHQSNSYSETRRQFAVSFLILVSHIDIPLRKMFKNIPIMAQVITETKPDRGDPGLGGLRTMFKQSGGH